MRLEEFSAARIREAVEVLEAALENCEEQALQHLGANGVTDKGFLNAYAWTEHVGNARDFLKNIADQFEKVEAR